MATKVAPGFVDLEDVFDERVDERGWAVINDAVTLSAELHTEAVQEVLETFVEEVPTPKEKYKMPVAAELQPLRGDDDSPQPHTGRISYNVGYPIRAGGWAWGTNRVDRAKMTVAEANEHTVAGTTADTRWLFRHLLVALFTPTGWTDDDEEFGDLSIVPLANSDTQEYLLADGTTATDTHYLAQAAAIDNTNDPYSIIHTELTEHPENMGDPIVYIATSLKATTEALSDFVPTPDAKVRVGSGTDVTIDGPNTPIGDKVLGRIDDCWVVEWKRLPSGYMVAHTEEGGPFIGMRQHEEAALRGLFPEFHNVDGNHYVSRLLRFAGFAVRRRTGALVYQIGAASYSAPSGYNAAPAPM